MRSLLLSVTLVGIGTALMAVEQLPDLQAVRPRHLQIQNEHQTESLRFSNGMANTGDGPLRLAPVFPGTNPDQVTQDAVQEILDEYGTIARAETVSSFEYHPEHNHWHIADVADFSVHVGSPDGPVYGFAGVKVTFCLVDWYKLEGQSKTPERQFFACDRTAETQGISPGWVDQYHHSTEGNELNITGAPPGDYYLVTIANPDGNFIEKDLTNNTAWTHFRLERNSNGNPKIVVLDGYPTTPPLDGSGAPNR